MGRSFTTALAAAAILAIATAPVQAKPKATKSGLTETDVITCIGTNGSTPKEQVAACTKVINSGKIKPPHEGDYYGTRGAAYFAMGQLNEALTDLNKALTYLQNPELYYQRALILMAIGENEKAKADLDQVAKAKPAYAPTYFMRGLIAYQAGAFPEAVKHFDDAIQRQPTYYVAIFVRGVAKKKAGDEDGGAEDLKAARGMSVHAEADAAKLGIKP
jgi:tetratricopeptide (TPR) repeat protein